MCSKEFCRFDKHDDACLERRQMASKILVVCHKCHWKGNLDDLLEFAELACPRCYSTAAVEFLNCGRQLEETSVQESVRRYVGASPGQGTLAKCL